MEIVRRSSNFVFYPVVAMLTLTTALIIVQPESSTFRVFTNHAIEIMFGIFGLSFLFLFARWHKLMFLAFGCVGVLCLFLKSSSNPAPIYAAPSISEDIEVIHLNISNHDWEDYSQLSDMILNTSADVVSIQEVTPDWDIELKHLLQDSFPYISSLASMGINGMSIFSKLPFSEMDTFYYKDVPNLTGIIKLGSDGKKLIRFVTTYTNPAFNSDKFYAELREHFTTIIEKLKYSQQAILAIGTYNTVAWSTEMKYLTGSLGLQNSKRSTNPFSQSSYEHIFHSQELECSDFGGVYTNEGTKVGLKVKLQFKNTPILFPYGPEPTQ